MAVTQQVYTTIEALLLHLATGATPGLLYDSAKAAQNIDFLWQAIIEASAMVSNRLERRFTPYLRTESIGIDALYDPRLLKLPDSALEVIGVTGGGGAPTVMVAPGASSFLLRTDADWTLSFRDRVEVEAVYGYHVNPAAAWQTVDASISFTANEVTKVVANASRYERGQLVRSDDEFMLITDIAINTNTLTLQRGINGTTATIHTDKPLQVYQVMIDVAEITREIAAHLYKNRHKVAEVFSLPGGGTVQTGSLAEDIWTTIDVYHPEFENRQPYR